MVVVTTFVAMTVVAFVVFSMLVMSRVALVSSGSSDAPETATR
jgi:hypothetical protein